MANRLRRLSCALIALVLLIAVVPAASAAGMGAYFHSNAKVYQKPSTSSASIGATSQQSFHAESALYSTTSPASL